MLIPSYNEFTDAPLAEEVTVLKAPSLTFGLELDGNRCKGKKDELGAMVQTIYMILRTEKGRYLIYPPWYGIATDDLYGKPHDYVFTELRERIKTALLVDDRIEDVVDFHMDAGRSTNDSLYIRYTVVTSLGDVPAEGVMTFV